MTWTNAQIEDAREKSVAASKAIGAWMRKGFFDGPERLMVQETGRALRNLPRGLYYYVLIQHPVQTPTTGN